MLQILSSKYLTPKLMKNRHNMRHFGLLNDKVLIKDDPKPTSWSKILDRTADIFLMTDIFRGMWLTFEVAMRPKVSYKYA